MSGKRSKKARESRKKIDVYMLKKEREMLQASLETHRGDQLLDYAAMLQRVAIMDRIIKISNELKKLGAE